MGLIRRRSSLVSITSFTCPPVAGIFVNVGMSFFHGNTRVKLSVVACFFCLVTIKDGVVRYFVVIDESIL